MWRLGIFYAAIASGAGANTQLKDSNFYELPYSFSTEAAAQSAAAVFSGYAGLFVITRIWSVS